MDRLMPTLGYRDPRAAIRFLVDALSAEQLLQHDDPASGEVYHAEVRLPGGGTVALHSGAEPNTLAALTARAGRDGYPPFGLHLETRDPDAAYARAVAAGATVVRELQDRPQGTRGFILRDPEGLYWSVSTPLPPVARDTGGRWRPVTGPAG